MVYPFNTTIAYHFDPIASFSFDPVLRYLDTVISAIAMPEVITTWTISVNPIDDLLARGFTIQRGHPWDTTERRRAAVDKFTDRQWKYFSSGSPEYHEYWPPPPPPSLPPTIPDFTRAPSFTSIIVAYTVADDVGILHAYAELIDSNCTLIELKEAVHIPSGVIEFLNLTPGSSLLSYIDVSSIMPTRGYEPRTSKPLV